MAKDVGNANMVSILLRASLSSWYGRLFLLAVLVAAAGAVYWYQDTLSETYSSIRENVISGLGFGVVVVALWICVFGFALVARRSWFRHYRLWLASPFVIAFILGALSFATSGMGPLAAFALDDGTLGGTLGYAIAGEVEWLGWIRLAGLVVIAGFVASPRGALDVLFALGRALGMLYVVAAGAVLWIGHQFGKVLHRSRENADPAQTPLSEELRRKVKEIQEQRSTSSESETGHAIPGSDLSPESSEQNGHHASSAVEDGTEAGQEYAELGKIDDASPVNGADGVLAEQVDEEERGAAYYGEDGDGVQEEYAGRVEMDAAYQDEDGIAIPTGQVESPEDGAIEDDGTYQILQADGEEADSIDQESVLRRGPGMKFNSQWGQGESDPKEQDTDELEANMGGGDGSNGRVPSKGQKVVKWTKPSLDTFVDANEGGIEPQEMEETARTIRNTLRNYGVGVEVTDTQPGPTVTMYGLKPGWIFRPKTETRVKVEAITARKKELVDALKPQSIRIETSVKGKFLVGVEVPNEGGIEQEEMDETARTIRETLLKYGVEVEVEATQPRQNVTMYGLKDVRILGREKESEDENFEKTNEKTQTRVKVDAITAREKELALALKTHSIRIETPVIVKGESLVGVEVPNDNPAMVTMRNAMQDPEFEDMQEKAKLPVGIGKGGSGETVVIDLAKMPHLLVAGSTGSGKSVFVNTVISCLLIEKDPSELRLLLIDPKRVELTPYNGIPHLLTPVVVETDRVVDLLRGLIREMMDRYRKMEEIGVRNIDSYNKKSPDQKMPYLVVAVDELADLMMTASVDVEQALCRLAQLGRATGIHMIIATQRPSVDVLTGLIKANFPSRVSFALTSQVDSRTILDSSGAEKLLGKGDMLYQSVDMSRPERVQGVFISDEEIQGLVKFWEEEYEEFKKRGGTMTDIDIEPVGGGGETDVDQQGDESGDRDDMMNKAIELAMSQKKVSTSLLQRRLRIGYPRAARLMDQLEDEGIVGPSDGSKSRDVIMGQV